MWRVLLAAGIALLGAGPVKLVTDGETAYRSTITPTVVEHLRAVRLCQLTQHNYGCDYER